MSRIGKLFERKRNRVLSIYCTAGYPALDSTPEIVRALEKYGADMVEIGMPYSDPLADGPVIQASSMKALQNGMTVEKLFDQVRGIRKEVSMPLILMGYMNPVLQYGFERFCADASATGIDGLILPDLPPHEFETAYREITNRNSLDIIFLVTPETPDSRVRMLDQLSSGFLYAVSSSSTTGGDKEIRGMEDYLERLTRLGLKNPVMVGFGIRDRTGFERAVSLAAGGIIGTAFIQALGEAEGPDESCREFISGIVHALK